MQEGHDRVEVGRLWFRRIVSDRKHYISSVWIGVSIELFSF